MMLASTVMALGCASFAASPKTATPQTNLERGYLEMYNLDFSAAHDTFHGYQQGRPDDPVGYVSNAAAYLFSEFDRLHILEADLFTDDQKFEHRAKVAPDPAVKTEFESELA